MVYSGQIDNIVTVEDKLVLQFIHVLLDLVVLNHNNNKVAAVEELVEVVELVGNNVLLDKGIV